ncbi:DUF2207 domain-containing protein [Tessaracoccus sp. SD287]|uniref:DUF2207 domain-containing protein n=1 Tax=Tessaracoccus sp. SD287 TaxID=2782008 RepID=UPI001A95766B|nr:DUF2207 domain-containing protein [Tessaracoccus sp. SD287]MBO1032120.1 DUF2207 domain-containing protein [Tessaracoccus sp. SD287]
MSRYSATLRRLLVGLAALLLACGFSLSAAGAAHADDDTPSSWQITKYHVVATPAQDGGTTTVEIDLDFDFARDKGHGPFIVLPLRMRTSNPDEWRMLDTQITGVSSGTGANTAQQVSREGGNMLVRIGSERQEYTGVQNYKISYTVHGILFPNHPESKLDEFNWNAVGTGWQVPMRDVKVTVNGPAEPRRTACFQGRSYQNTCAAPAPGRQMVWTIDRLATEQGLQVVAGYPVGTFTNADYRTTKRYHAGNMFPLDAPNLGGAAVVGVASIAGVGMLARRRGRDQAWAGVAPGLAPARGQNSAVGVRDTKAPVAVTFRPPKGARPGEIGTLIDEKADLKDVTATLVDLAVRGHMRFEQIDKKNQKFTRLKGTDKLAPYESKLMGTLFGGSQVVTTQDIRDKSRGKAITEAQSDLYRRVSTEPLKWFRENPNTARTLAAFAGIGLVVAGLGLSFLLGLLGYGLIPLGVAVAGVVLMIFSGSIPARTPAGSAVYAEAKGFELYLKTAEADQIKFEEGIDVFSRYLPYAVVFGVADRWTKIFEKLAADGRYYGDTSWYGGYGYGMGYGFAASFDGLTNSMESAMQASAHAASAASSGSGFSGGGGAGGGGGGGW